jgi:DnaJ-class molecular chaperone
MQCLDCKGHGITFPLVKVECACLTPKKCIECGGAKYKYDIVPTRCESCKGAGFKK